MARQLQSRFPLQRLPLKPLLPSRNKTELKAGIPAYLGARWAMDLLDTTLSEADWKPDALSLRMSQTSPRVAAYEETSGIYGIAAGKDKTFWTVAGESEKANITEISAGVEILPSCMFEDQRNYLKIRHQKGPPILKQSKARRKQGESLAWIRLNQLYTQAEANFRSKLRLKKPRAYKAPRPRQAPLPPPPQAPKEPASLSKLPSKAQIQMKLAKERKLLRVKSLKEELRRSEELRLHDSEALLQAKSAQQFKKSLLNLPIYLKG